ncbi:hypothetical protein HMPREF1020_03814, partial [Clostridium sp. 7_3_54FAA]
PGCVALFKSRSDIPNMHLIACHLLNYKNGDLNIAGSLLYTTAETTYANGGITQTGSIEVIESIICRIDKYFKYAPHINIKRNSSICIVKSNCFMECSPIAILHCYLRIFIRL